jgi:uncharacterized RDD family membrane protein YckC
MEGVRYASAWHRFVGYWIDAFILNIVLALLIVAMAPAGMESQTLLPAVFGLFWLATVLYYTVMDASVYQGTLGKMAMGVKVADAESGGRISYLRSFARYVVFSISFMFIVPLLVIFFSSKKRMLHDMAVGSLVTDLDAEHPGKYRWTRRLAPLLLLLGLLFPAVVGTYYINNVIGEFLQSAEAQMLTAGAQPTASGSGAPARESHHVTYDAQGKVNSESYETTYVENGVVHSSGWSWSHTSTPSVSGSAHAHAAPAASETPRAEVTAQLFELAKGGKDADYEAIRLIVRGADVNARDADGYTPLYYAVKGHHVEMVKALVFNHAKTGTKYRDGVTVWMLAKNDRSMQKALRYAHGK